MLKQIYKLFKHKDLLAKNEVWTNFVRKIYGNM